MTKKPSAFKIGIFTVFLVVMVITMLKSVVDSAPILFVKLGQDNAGAIDFTVKSTSGSYNTVPVNYYNINPFEGLYGALPEESETEEANQLPGCVYEGLSPGVYSSCPDYVELSTGTIILKSDYLNEKTSSLE